MPNTDRPAYPQSQQALAAHVRACMDFYHPRCLDAAGGMYHFFLDDGEVYDPSTRHLVSSTRFVFTYATCYRLFGDPAYLQGCEHALRFIEEHHALDNGGYAWLLQFTEDKTTLLDEQMHCYGLAFVLLAYAQAAQVGVAGAKEGIAKVYALMEQRFWQAEHGLYADEADYAWRLGSYRGQNANMHSCEAMLACWDATQDTRYLHRAETLARNICLRQAALAGGEQNRIWEHYDVAWQIDWDYHRDDPKHLFRPWGFQPGHSTEWAKLLLIMERHTAHLQHATDWILPAARALFDEALTRAWDAEHGGICYGFAPDGTVCDSDKYHWVQAESLAAAKLLALRTGDAKYQQIYDQLFAYIWQHFVDHENGGWWRILRADNSKYSDEKSPAGKVDYHNIGALVEILHAIDSAETASK